MRLSRRRGFGGRREQGARRGVRLLHRARAQHSRLTADARDQSRLDHVPGRNGSSRDGEIVDVRLFKRGEEPTEKLAIELQIDLC